MMTLVDSLSRNARAFPERTAVVCRGERLGYGGLDELSDSMAARLIRTGIAKGDRVALFMNNSVEYVVSYFAVMKAGAAVVAFNTQLVSAELAPLLEDCAPRAVLATGKGLDTMGELLSGPGDWPVLLDAEALLRAARGGAPEAFGLMDLREEDLAAIIYTSGTTGKPKGVMLSHRNVAANADSIIEYLHLTPDDRVMVILPFSYSYGSSLLTTHIRAGGALVIDNRFVYPNTVLEAMEREEVTGFAGVPSHFAILLRKSALANYRLPKLRYVTQAGGAMSPAMIGEFRSLLPHVRFYVMYGQTEATARLSYLEPDDLERKTGSVGRGIPGVTIEVVGETGEPVRPGETGEITARGENIMQGYWKAPAETEKVLRDGRLYTGDLARVDGDGFIYIVSRKKDMIKSGANRISPLEIENAVCAMPGVVECAAIGMPDEILGESIRLFVVKKPEIQMTADEVTVFCRRNMAFYKVPRSIEFIENIPKTASGKIKREELKALNSCQPSAVGLQPTSTA